MSTVPTYAPPGYVCPFRRVVHGEDNGPDTVQADVVDRTLETTAWIGSRWWARNPGHVIVVTNEHVENIFSLSRERAADFHETAQRIAFATKYAYACEGISTPQHDGPAGYQEIWHYHLHVFPRYAGADPYRSPWRDTTLTRAGRTPRRFVRRSPTRDEAQATSGVRHRSLSRRTRTNCVPIHPHRSSGRLLSLH